MLNRARCHALFKNDLCDRLAIVNSILTENMELQKKSFHPVRTHAGMAKARISRTEAPTISHYYCHDDEYLSSGSNIVVLLFTFHALIGAPAFELRLLSQSHCCVMNVGITNTQITQQFV